MKGWEKLQNHGCDLVTFASGQEIVLPDDIYQLRIQFYPVPPQSPSSPETLGSSEETSIHGASFEPVERPTQRQETPSIGNGPIAIELGDARKTNSDVFYERLTMLAGENRMAVEDQLAALNSLRLITLIRDPEQRCKLLSIRLLAMATYSELQ